MKFTDLFIRRPVIAIVVSLVILIAGIQAIRTLNARQYPRSENAEITVTTTYVGANAELVRGFVTTPLERVIAAADGIDYIESESKQNVSIIRARLRLNYDASKALAEIGSKIDQVRGDLPRDAEIPVVSVVSADSQFAAAYLSFSSRFLKQNEITDYLVRVVQPRLSAVPGVQRADIIGARTFAMRVWLKPDRMAALDVSPAQVRQALAANNYLAAVGETKGSLVQVNLTANTDLRSVDEFKQLVVRKRGGAVIRLGEIADVVLGAEDYDAAVAFNGQTAVFVGIWALPNANSLDVVKGVRAELDSIQKQLPEQIEARVAYDATSYISDAIHEVQTTLAETLLIVVAVIFLFLGSMRSVLVPVVAIPVSLVGAFFLMQVFGFTLNLLTLLAIVLSVGLVVDDAIVVVENVERHLREGAKPIDAAIQGVRELVGPIIAMTITLAAVYTPIAFQGGLTGSLFREFALTLAGAVAISGVVALTLSPMMSAYLLRAEERGLARRISAGFERIRALYARLLDRALRSRGSIYAAWGVVSLLALAMFSMAPRELAPTEDQGVILGVVNTPSNSTLDQLAPSTQSVYRTVREIPESAFTFQITNPNTGFWGFTLKPWEERKRSAFQVLPEVTARVAAIPGIQSFPILPPALPGGGQFPVEFVIASTAESSEVLDFARKIQEKATASGMFAFPPLIDVKIDQPSSEIALDRDKVAELGLDLQTIGQDLGAATGGNYVNRFSIGGRSYKVIPQVLRSERLNPEQLKDIHVTGPNGQLVALDALATLRETVTPRSLNRFQQLNSVKISGVAIRPLDQALRMLEDEAAKILPKGYTLDYTGESRQLRTEGNKFLPAFVLALVLIFLVLAAQFNSFRDPFVILAGSVPLGMFGAMVVMFLKMPNPTLHYFTDGWTTTLNVYSQVGLVTLVGLVAKNGILIVEFANKLQEQGHTKLEAVKEAAATRLRPILMTSVATVLGHVPLTLVSGPGAKARNSIGLVLVSGMTVGTLFTLFFLPAIYLLIARDHGARERLERTAANTASRAALWTGAAAALLVAWPASALQPLGSFLASAVRRNPDALESQADVAQQEAQSTVALGRVLPGVSAAASYIRNEYRSQLALPAPDGGEASVTVTPYEQRLGTATLRVPLIDLANLRRVTAANTGAESAARRRDATELEIQAQVVQDYYQLVANVALASAAREALWVSRESLRLAEARVAAGAAATLEVDRARADVEAQVQQVASAELQIELEARALESASGVAPVVTGPVALDDDLHPEPGLASFEAGLRALPSLASARLETRAAEQQAQAQRLSLVPSLGGSLTETGTDAPGIAGHDWSYQGVVSLSWSFDLGTVGAIRSQDAAVDAARAKELRTQLAAADAIHRQWNTIAAAIARSRSARAGREAAVHASDQARTRYLAGATTQLELLQAQRDAFGADVARIQADADLVNARAQLRLAAGQSLLATRG